MCEKGLPPTGDNKMIKLEKEIEEIIKEYMKEYPATDVGVSCSALAGRIVHELTPQVEMETVKRKFIREFCNDHSGEVRWLRGVSYNMETLLEFVRKKQKEKNKRRVILYAKIIFLEDKGNDELFVRRRFKYLKRDDILFTGKKIRRPGG